MPKKQISDLIQNANANIEVYNKIANDLKEQFDIQSAEITLLVTYYLTERLQSFM